MLSFQDITKEGAPVSDSLSFKYTLTEEDFVRTLRYHARRRMQWFLWVLLAVIVFAVASVVFYLIDRPRLNADEILARILMIIVPTYLFWWLWWWHPKRVAHDAPYLDVEIDGTASADGIASLSRLGNHETTWGSYSAALESNDHFLLYLGRSVFNPFPKRAFTDPKDVHRFRDLIRAHVPNARLLDRGEK